MRYKLHRWALVLAAVACCTACKKEEAEDSTKKNSQSTSSQESLITGQGDESEETNSSETEKDVQKELGKPAVVPEDEIAFNPFVIDPMEEIEDITEQIPQNTSGSAMQSASAPSIFDDNTKAYIDEQGTTVAIKIHSNNITITGVIASKGKTITIPAMIDHKPVVSIGSNAFEDVDVANVILSDGITTIESQAFYANTNIKKISIPESVTSIGANAFGNCSSLEEFELPGNNTNYCLSNGVLYNKQKTSLIRYPAAKAGKTYHIEKGVDTIEDGAFSMSNKIEFVSFPDSLRSIKTEAFAGCLLLDVDIPDTIVELESFAFADCCSLTEIVVPKQIEEIAEGTFSGCESATTIKMMGKVKEIGYSAFANCSSVNKVEFASPALVIGEMSFAFCTSLKDIELSDGTKEIADMAFYSCNSLKDITIPDTVSYFGSMIFDEDGSVVIHTPQGSSAAEYAQSNGIACDQQ